MHMLVMLVMHMLMFVLQFLMGMPVLVLLCQVQPYA
jgi:hypothetical protein